MHNYRIRRWNGDVEIENQTIRIPINIDWLGHCYRCLTDWTCFYIEEMDDNGAEIGTFSVSKRIDKKVDE